MDPILKFELERDRAASRSEPGYERDHDKKGCSYSASGQLERPPVRRLSARDLETLRLNDDAFSLFGGMESEIVLSDDCAECGGHELERGQPFQLAIETGLVVIRGDDSSPGDLSSRPAQFEPSFGVFLGNSMETVPSPVEGFTTGPLADTVIPTPTDWKVDHSESRFRINPITGCTKSRLTKLKAAWVVAYDAVRSAEREVAYIANYFNSGTQRLLWDASGGNHEQCSLAFWFGKSSEPDFADRLHHVNRVIRRWSRAFREGFYKSNKKPVLIKCKTLNCAFGAARHVVRNYIELCGQWSKDKDPSKRAIRLMHEMGHFADGDAYHPRDEKYKDLCFSSNTSRCYRGVQSQALRHKDIDKALSWRKAVLKSDSEAGESTGLLFNFVANTKKGEASAGARNNPRVLIREYERPDISASDKAEVQETFLNNIDNYVCYMWNRWVDREYRRLEPIGPTDKQP